MGNRLNLIGPLEYDRKTVHPHLPRFSSTFKKTFNGLFSRRIPEINKTDLGNRSSVVVVPIKLKQPPEGPDGVNMTGEGQKFAGILRPLG